MRGRDGSLGGRGGRNLLAEAVLPVLGGYGQQWLRACARRTGRRYPRLLLVQGELVRANPSRRDAGGPQLGVARSGTLEPRYLHTFVPS